MTKSTPAFVEPENFENVVPTKGDLAILYEDDSLLVLNKAQGVVIHPAIGHRGETLVHHLLYYLQGSPEFPTLSPTRPGIVHRLDRGTSGLLLVAKNRDALEELSRQFKQREIKKEYEAIAYGAMKTASGRFESTIGRDPKDRKKMSSRSKDGREALTLWTRKEAFHHFTYVRLFPHTGRTHQLRVHLTEASHPIVGDDLYGKGSRTRRAPFHPDVEALVQGATQTFLHAAALHLVHPSTKKKISFEAPLPENFKTFLDALRKYD